MSMPGYENAAPASRRWQSQIMPPHESPPDAAYLINAGAVIVKFAYTKGSPAGTPLFAQTGEAAMNKAAVVWPARLYVDVSTVAKQASRLVFLVSLFFLVLSSVTGVALIHPVVSIFFC